jgi:thymidine phosphorylase
VQRIDAREVGLTTVAMGGGRMKKGDPIDLAVGVVVEAKVGDAVQEGQPICVVHAPSDAVAAEAATRLRAAWQISDAPAAPLPVILDLIRGS